MSSMPACRSPSVANRAGTVAMVKSPGATSSISSQRDRRGHRRLGHAAHRVGAGDGVVAGVLVVVDEQRPRVAVLAPPRGRDVVRRAALDLAGEGERGPAYVGEAPARLDPDVDVQALAARGLRPARRRRARRAPRARRGRPGARVSNPQSGHRVEVDAPLVGPLGVGPAGVPRVELHGRHLHRPDHAGQLGHAQLVGVPARTGGRTPGPSPPTAARRAAAASGAPSRR